LLPPFLEEQPTGAQGQPDPVDKVSNYFREYHALAEEIQEEMSYNDYCNLRMRNRPRIAQHQQNFDLMRKIGKLTVPSFDGSAKSTARAWVHKLDTYFQLNPMTEAEAIKFSTLHLDEKLMSGGTMG
jgi:hypothetical protein